MGRIILVLAIVWVLLAGLLIACTSQSVDVPSRASGSITGVSLTGDMLVGASTAVTVTDGMVITPTHTTYVLSAAGAVGLTLGASCDTGQMLYLYGEDAQTITVADTNIYTTDGSTVAIGQYDVVGWICNGNKWFHLFKSANS